LAMNALEFLAGEPAPKVAHYSVPLDTRTPRSPPSPDPLRWTLDRWSRERVGANVLLRARRLTRRVLKCPRTDLAKPLLYPLAVALSAARSDRRLRKSAVTSPAFAPAPVTLKGSLDVPALERPLLRWAAHHDERNALTVDLGAVRFIDAVALLHLLAVMTERAERDLSTVLRLPRTRTVRDFLRAWNFPQAIRSATGLPLQRFVADDDLAYFGEGQRHFTRPDQGPAGDDLLGYLERKRFFGLMTYHVSPHDRPSWTIEQEWSRWRSPLILEVLDKHLRGPGRDVARVVIYELLANAIQHPQARTAAVVSSVNRVPGPGGPIDRSLTISVWDDGRGIVETLRRCLDAGQRIRVADARVEDEFTVVADGWHPGAERRLTTWTPDPDAADGELLLASVFPGVSQKATYPTVTIDRPEPTPWAAETGYGLHALYRSVIDNFKGSLAIRTGQHFMNLKSTRGTQRAYRAKIVHYPDQAPFRGNLVTIRVPVRKPQP